MEKGCNRLSSDLETDISHSLASRLPYLNPKVQRRNLTLVGNTPMYRRHREPPIIFRLAVHLARWAMGSDPIEGPEWGPTSLSDVAR